MIRRRITSVAAVLLAFFAGYYMADQSIDDKPASSTNTELSSVNSPNESVPSGTNGTETTTINQQFNESPSNEMASTIQRVSSEKPTNTSFYPKAVNLATNTMVEEPLLVIAATLLPEMLSESDLYVPEPEIPPLFHRIALLSGYQALANATDPPPSITAPSFRRWSVTGSAGQTMANYYQRHTPANDQLMYRHDMISTTPERVMNPKHSMGAEIRYQITRNFGVSGGVAMHQFATNIADAQQPELATLSSTQTVGNALGVVAFNQKTRNDLVKKPVIQVSAEQFEQHLSYVEIPLTASWRLADRRLGFGINAGFGTNFLINNTVTLVNDQESTTIGYTEGVRDVYFSGIFSMDLILNLHPKWSWSFTPLYRHALQPVSEGELDPRIISFGLYSGLQYRF